MKFDMPTCGGCRTCEMGCSFKHAQEFNPSIASIQILEKRDGPGYTVWVVEQGEGKNIPCDGCKDFPVPICMEYCREREDLEKILKEFTHSIREHAGKPSADLPDYPGKGCGPG